MFSTWNAQIDPIFSTWNSQIDPILRTWDGQIDPILGKAPRMVRWICLYLFPFIRIKGGNKT